MSKHQLNAILDYFFHNCKENGFSSIRELKNLQLNTLDFNMGEKERMKPLLASDQTKYDSSSGAHNTVL